MLFISFFSFPVYTLLTENLHLSINPVQHKYELLHKQYYYGVYLQQQNVTKFYFIEKIIKIKNFDRPDIQEETYAFSVSPNMLAQVKARGVSLPTFPAN